MQSPGNTADMWIRGWELETSMSYVKPTLKLKANGSDPYKQKTVMYVPLFRWFVSS